jgi:hypothetical protein
MLGPVRWAEALSGGSELAMKLAINNGVASKVHPVSAGSAIINAAMPTRKGDWPTPGFEDHLGCSDAL